MATLEQVIEALSAALPDVDADELEQTPTGRITGSVVSARFDDLDYHERQIVISNAIEDRLSPDERRYVGPIVAMSTYEAEFHAADAELEP